MAVSTVARHFMLLRDTVDNILIDAARSGSPTTPTASFQLGAGSFLGPVSESPMVADAVNRSLGQRMLPAGLIAVIGKGGSGKTTFLDNCYRGLRNHRKVYAFSGEPILRADRPALLSVSWLLGDLMHALDPAAAGAENMPRLGYVGSGNVVYVDSLTDFINYTTLGATQGGYGRDLGELYHALQWAAYLSGTLIIGTVNPYTSNDDHFQFVFGSLENRVMSTVVLGDLTYAGVHSQPLFGGPGQQAGQATSGRRVARVYIRDVARGNASIPVEL